MLSIQFFPPRILAVSMPETLSPTALTIVAGASTSVPIMVISGMASGGYPYYARIKSSPIVPPPGMPLTTTPVSKAMPSAVSSVSMPTKGI